MTTTRSETGHTPGPWALRFSHDGSGDVGITAPGLKNVLAECFSSMRSHDERAEAEAKANAYLIIAAPDLEAAAGPAITALAFEQENALARGDELAFKQITAAKAGLIAALAKARGGYHGLNIIEGAVVEARLTISKATGAQP